MQRSAPKYSLVQEHSPMQIKMVEILAYFDIFNYPVTETELCNLLGLSSLEFLSEVTPLLENLFCYRYLDYYSTCIKVNQIAELRGQQELLAQQYFKKLKKYARIISLFPFVRGIAVSGSLSKGVMQVGGDIDFFVITQTGRLWLCRSLLILYKKILLLNSHKYFCLNYFIDQNNLTIIDKNIFTATELYYLIPVYSSGNTMANFFKSNEWVLSYYRENTDRSTEYIVNNQSVSKKLLEKLLMNPVGNLLEKLFHQQTLKKWSRKFGHFDQKKFELTMRSTTGVSKHHPRDFQSSVLKLHAEKVASILYR